MVIICLTIRNCKIIRHCVILQSHQQSTKVFVASHVCLCLVLFQLFFGGGLQNAACGISFPHQAFYLGQGSKSQES